MDNTGSIFTDTARLHHRYHHNIFMSYDLYRGQNRLFDKLSESGEVSQTELARKMNIAPATLTRMVQNMEKKGYLTRKKDKLDQRITLISLTPKGQKTRSSINQKLEDVDQRIFKNFTEDERRILKDMLLRIQDHLLKELKDENNN
jgi:DNA-binding MarR family transcriptional regulator